MPPGSTASMISARPVTADRGIPPARDRAGGRSGRPAPPLPPGQGLAGADQARPPSRVLAGEHRAGPAEPGLDLVGDEHDAVLAGELGDAGEETGGGDDEAAPARERPRPQAAHG